MLNRMNPFRNIRTCPLYNRGNAIHDSQVQSLHKNMSEIKIHIHKIAYNPS